MENAEFELQVYTDGAKLVKLETGEVVESFPKNRARFDNPQWDRYLRTHRDMKWRLKYMCEF